MPANLALVGCGAISQAVYLPTLARLRGEFERVWLVDPSARALRAAAGLVPGLQARCLDEVDGDLDGVIVATPNEQHYLVARKALLRRAHVLMEKPLVIWPGEGRELVEMAARGGRVLAVNQTRRFFPLTRELRRRIGDAEFGCLGSIVHTEGTKLLWPFESGAAFAKGAQRTGVIMDFGVHVIDFYHYLLQPTWAVQTAIHDGIKGPEGLAEIRLMASGADVSIKLSRYRGLENVALLRFEQAEVSFGVYDTEEYEIRWKSGRRERCRAVSPRRQRPELGDSLVRNFLAAAQGRERPVCDGLSSLPVIEVLDRVYRQAGRYPATVGSV